MKKISFQQVVAVLLFVICLSTVAYQVLTPRIPDVIAQRMAQKTKGQTPVPKAAAPPQAPISTPKGAVEQVKQVLRAASSAVGLALPGLGAASTSRVLGTNPPTLMATQTVARALPRWVGLMRDPFQARYLDTDKKEEVPIRADQVLKLSAIWSQTGCRLAVINLSFVKEGDLILGFKIQRIESHQVAVVGVAGLVEFLPLLVAPGKATVAASESATNDSLTLTNDAAAPADGIAAPAEGNSASNLERPASTNAPPAVPAPLVNPTNSIPEPSPGDSAPTSGGSASTGRAPRAGISLVRRFGGNLPPRAAASPEGARTQMDRSFPQHT